MKVADINTSLIDQYYMILKNLSANNKLELIARLSESLKSNKAADDSWKSLFGALKLDCSAEDFVKDLENDRNFDREPIDL